MGSPKEVAQVEYKDHFPLPGSLRPQTAASAEEQKPCRRPKFNAGNSKEKFASKTVYLIIVCIASFGLARLRIDDVIRPQDSYDTEAVSMIDDKAVIIFMPNTIDGDMEKTVIPTQQYKASSLQELAEEKQKGGKHHYSDIKTMHGQRWCNLGNRYGLRYRGGR